MRTYLFLPDFGATPEKWDTWLRISSAMPPLPLPFSIG